MDLDQVVLRYVAGEVVCSAWEITEFVRLYDGTGDEATELLARWQHLGWLTVASEADEGGPQMLALTEQAFEEHPWLSQAT
jgi:hypothetical protein